MLTAGQPLKDSYTLKFLPVDTMNYFSLATLTSNSTVACPDGDTATFTCTLPSTEVRWTVIPPPHSGFVEAEGIVSSSFLTITLGVPGFMFQAVLTDSSGGMATSTLTTVTDASLLDGTMVRCDVVGGVSKGPLSITVAGECYQVGLA